MTDTIEATAEKTEPPTKKQRQAARLADAASGRNRWIIFKIAMLAIVDAVALYAVAVLAAARRMARARPRGRGHDPRQLDLLLAQARSRRST